MIGTTARYRTSVTANMNLIGERSILLVSLSYRYRVQCDRGFKKRTRETTTGTRAIRNQSTLLGYFSGSAIAKDWYLVTLAGGYGLKE